MHFNLKGITRVLLGAGAVVGLIAACLLYWIFCHVRVGVSVW